MNFDEYTAPNGPWTKIDGWSQQGVFAALHLLNEIHKKYGITGNIGEIGVHEGQLFCALALLADPRTERLLAIDVFDEQKKNVDMSGGSTFDIFYENMRSIIGERKKTFRAIESDSLDVDPENIFSSIMALSVDSSGIPHYEGYQIRSPYFRFFSIDGGHTVVHVLNDLRLVERVMVPGGIVIVDDFMHPKWPGVTEALHIYCSNRASRLVPFAYGNNKMYLTTFHSRKLYSKWIEGNPHPSAAFFSSKKVELYGRNLSWIHFTPPSSAP